MQAILIGLATAVILTISAAFAAPFVVDWTAWRGMFEAQASRALGVPVLIRGRIDAEILPSPRVVLRGVALGTDDVSTGGTVRELRADLSLGALVRGEVEASSLTLSWPNLRLVLDSSGRLVAPAGAGRPGSLSIGQIAIENGELAILDRGADRTVNLTDLNLKGEARGVLGPFRLDGEVTTATERYSVRTSLGRLGDDGGKLRLIADGRTRAFGIDLDGQVRFADGVPRFDGKGTVLRRGETSGTEAWRLSAALRASPEAVVAESLDLTLGEDTRPVQLSGSARLSLGRAVGLDAVLNARSLDLDALRPTPAAPGPGAAQTPADVLSGMVAAFSALPAPDVTSRIGIAVDQLTVGGTVIRDARADLTGTAQGWRMDTAEAKLPGQTSVRLSGVPARAADGGSFGGDLLVTSEDPSTFLRWAAPRLAPDYIAAVKGPVRIAGRIATGTGRYAVTGLDASFARARMRGAAALVLPVIGVPRIDLQLALDGVDLDPLVAAGRKGLVGAATPFDGAITLDGQNLTLSGLPLRGLAVTAQASGQAWTLSRFALDDLAGLKISGAGAFDTRTSSPTGRLDLTVAGAKADGLVPMARLVAGPEAADAVTRLLPVASPVQLTSSATWGETGAHSFTAEGTLGQISGRAAFARTDGSAPSRVALALAAGDGARALEAAGLPGLRAGQGPAKLDLTIDPRSDGTAAFDGRLALGDAVASGTGSVRLAPDGTVLPTLDMRLEGPDLPHLLAASGATDGAVPGALTFSLSRGAGLWRFEKLTGTLAGAPVSGALDLDPGTPPKVTGRLELDSLSLPRLIGLWGARSIGPEVGAAPWSGARFTAALPVPAAFALDLAAKRVEMGGAYAIADGRARVVADSNSLELRDLSGGFGSGHLTGALALRRRGDGLQADGRLTLDAVDSALLLAPLAPRTPPRGHVTLALDLVGSGRTPLAIIQAMSGQGTLAVRDLEIPAADPKAIETVLADTATGAPPDERRTAALLDRAFARGPLRLESAETTFGVVNGVARLSPARVSAAGMRVALTGSLDLTRLTLEAGLDMDGADVAGAVPGGSISWRGPVAAPERRVTATALTSVIAMRAIERETKRLEERQGLRPPAPDAAPAAAAPSAPANPPAPAAPPAAPSAATPPAAPSATPAPSPGTGAPAAANAPVTPTPSPTAPTPMPAPATPAPQPAPAPAAMPVVPLPPPAPTGPREPRPVEPRQSENRAPPLPPPVEISPSGRPKPLRPDFDLPPPPTVGGFGTMQRPPGLLPE